MKNAFKVGLGFYLGKFVAQVTIELIGRSAQWLLDNKDDPVKGLKQLVKEEEEKKKSKQEPIKMGFC